MALIELRDIVKTYQMGDTEQTVLHAVSLDIYESEMLAIMGPSGSGKSTLMNIIGILDRPSRGQYYLRGSEVEALDDDDRAVLRNINIGFVFQQFFLLPKLTAEENVALPLVYRGVPEAEIKQRVMPMLDKVGMADRSHHKPNELSGGQQQRVAIARALIGDPEIILADEPTGALDTKTGDEVLDLFARLNAEEKRTIIVVTHDPDVGKACKRIVRVQDGHILQQDN